MESKRDSINFDTIDGFVVGQQQILQKNYNLQKSEKYFCNYILLYRISAIFSEFNQEL